MDRKKTLQITLCGLFAALTAICSQIQIPLPQIPINLALFAVFMAGVILGPYAGAVSIMVYVLLGMVGIPVFAGFKGGLAAITGSTGGYIIGYIFCAFLTGLVVKCTKGKAYHMVIGMMLGLFVCYGFGTAWFIFMSGMTFQASFSVCVLPFLPGDTIKIALATIISERLRHMIREIYELNP